MIEISFQDIPKDKIPVLNKDNHSLVHKIYNLFSFKYLCFPCSEEISTEKPYNKQYTRYLVDFLKKFKFITYFINNSADSSNDIDTQSDDQNLNIFHKFKIGTVFCVEQEIIIIDQTNKSIITEIITEINTEEIKIINASIKNENVQQSNEELHIEEEIENLYKYLKQNNKKIEENKSGILDNNNKEEEFNKNLWNKIFQNTHRPIFSYLIRRYFCPTEYFKDPSFFYFKGTKVQKESNEPEELYEQHIKNKLINFLGICDPGIDEYREIKNKLQNKIINRKQEEFQENNFITLRNIYHNDQANFYLVIHIDTLYIFMMKKLDNPTIKHETKEVEHETYFCKNFTHRCLTHFYGFVEDKNKTQIIGYVYDFMSNGSLKSFMKSNSEKIDEIFLLMTIDRLYQAIKYFQTNNLIHRDIKPDNILIDHDFIPYISDFDTIRPIDDPESKENTNNFGPPIYSSPELLDGWDKLNHTDIFSFGLIIYYLYEKKDPPLEKKTQINLSITNVSTNLQNIFKGCTKEFPSQRITIEEIKTKLIEEFQTCFEEEFTSLKSFEMKQFIYENYMIQNDNIETFIFYCILSKKFISGNFNFIKLISELYKNILENGGKYSEVKENILTSKLKKSDALLYLGFIYENGLEVEQDYNKAKELYELLSKQNNSNALLFLGNLYYSGNGVEQSYLRAMEYFKLSANQNNPGALHNLGVIYLNGLGVEKDYSKAREYFELSGKNNTPEALYNLGFMYMNGYGVDQDYPKAKEYFELASKQENPYILNNLGKLYEKGQVFEQDYLQAIKYYKSAEQYNSDALVNIGNLYYLGYGVDRDYNKAHEYYQLASNKNNSDGYAMLGELYYYGHGVEQNYTTAKMYYELSAKQNNPSALLNLGNLYEKGFGVEQNYSTAKEYYELSAKQNNPDALLFLGNLYERGYGVKIDYCKAREYYELAKNHNKFKAFNILGIFYENGLGVEKDYTKAREYYEIALKHNIFIASLNLGELYFDGKGVPKDYLKAKQYYEISSQQGYSEGTFKIGNLYLNGFGVEQSYSKAKEYFELAAQKNNPDALYQLGELYYHGQGVYQNYEKAKYYYELSAKYLNSKAAFKLGYHYFSGDAFKQDYFKSKKYLEIASSRNNPDALYFLGELYSRGDIFEVDYDKAIKYFIKSTKIHYGGVKIEATVDGIESIDTVYNNYYYHSNNDLGLIYITFFQDVEKGNKFIKESAFGEYPFA